MADKPTPLLQLLREATNWTDAQIGDLVGIPAGSIYSIRIGRIPEKLSDIQRKLVIIELHEFLKDGAEVLAEIEMRS